MLVDRNVTGRNLRYSGVDILSFTVVETSDGSENVVYFTDIRFARRPTWKDSVMYYVKDGDMLDALAYYFYGKEELWWIIADQNKIDDPDDIQMGDVLEIPPLRVAAQY